MLDLLIRGGLIIDGSGNPGFYGAVAVEDERVRSCAATRPTADAQADRAGTRKYAKGRGPAFHRASVRRRGGGVGSCRFRGSSFDSGVEEDITAH